MLHAFKKFRYPLEINVKRLPPALEKFYSKNDKLPWMYTILGSVIAFAGGFFQLWYQERKRDEKEKKDTEEKYRDSKLFAKDYIKRSERNLMNSRNLYVNNHKLHTVDQALTQARCDAERVRKVLDKMSVAENLRFSKDEGYSIDSVLHLLAHIDYHRASLLLKESDIDGANSLLGKSSASRVGLHNDENERLGANEIARTKIKIADASSQMRHIDISLHFYNEIIKTESNLLHIFWRSRALNNMSIVLFAVGADGEAIKKMKMVGDEITDYLDNSCLKSVSVPESEDHLASKFELEKLLCH